MSAIGGAGAGPQSHSSEGGEGAVPDGSSRFVEGRAVGIRPAAQQRENARAGATFGGRCYGPWVLIGLAGRNENLSGETIRSSPRQNYRADLFTMERTSRFLFLVFCLRHRTGGTRVW